MAGSVNKVILVGNVGQDPEVRTLGNGKVVNLSLATSETWNDKASGEKKTKTEWHRVVVFNERIAEVVEKYVKKGHKLYVEGALQTRKWSDKDGVEKYSTEIVVQNFRGEVTMLGGGESGDAREPSSPPARSASRAAGSGRPAASSQWETPRGGGAALDDEIPFFCCWQ